MKYFSRSVLWVTLSQSCLSYICNLVCMPVYDRSWELYSGRADRCWGDTPYDIDVLAWKRGIDWISIGRFYVALLNSQRVYPNGGYGKRIRRRYWVKVKYGWAWVTVRCPDNTRRAYPEVSMANISKWIAFKIWGSPYSPQTWLGTIEQGKYGWPCDKQPVFIECALRGVLSVARKLKLAT